MRERLSAARERAYRAINRETVLAFVVTMLMITSTFVGGIALVGTQPLADGQSGTASAAEGDFIKTYNNISSPWGDVTIVNGKLYIGNGNQFSRVDLDTGEVEWNYSTGARSYSAPIVSNGTVYSASRDDRVFALNASTGEELWRFTEPMNEILASPELSDGVVYAPSRDGYLYAINASTGNREWSAQIAGSGTYQYSSPIVADGTVYQPSGNGSVMAFDAETGETKWVTSVGSSVYSAPTLDDGDLFVGDTGGTAYSIDAQTGKLNWNFSTAGKITGTTTYNGTVYFGSEDGYTMYAVDTKTGVQKWSFQAKYDLTDMTAPTVANSTIYFTNKYAMFALDAETGVEQWSYDTNDNTFVSPAIVADGTVYAAEAYSGVNALDTGHSKSSAGTREKFATLGHVGELYQSTGPTLNGTDEQNLSIDTRSLFKPNSTHPYAVLLDDVGDVTENATLTISNTTLLSKDTTNETLTSINDSNTTATVTLNATHTDADGTTRSVEKQVVIAESSVENLEILPGGTERGSAVLSDGFFQALLVALFVGVMMTRFTSAFGGLAGGQMVLTIGWFSGYVSWAMAAVSLFVALFIGLNLAANIDYTVRQ